jgi:CHRD domain-containing protein
LEEGIMRNRILSLAVAAAVSFPAAAFADAIGALATATLKSVSEVPSVISPASARFTATVTATQIKYKLQFSGLTGDTFVSHIHVGQQHTNGNVSVFLCNNTPSGPAPQPCPNGSGTITGTITAADVTGPAGQGVDPQEFQALLDAIAQGAAYVNIHTSAFPNGETRGQIIQLGIVRAAD